MKQLKIIFMGTPDFSVPALKILPQSGYEVALVVTRPDRPRGRGCKLTPPPVKAAALDLGLPVVQPQTIRDPLFINQMRALEPDLFVVVAMGQILPQELLDIPSSGAINIHGSLLPCYRGPAPIQWALINNERETGITTMLMDNGLDTGDILMTARTRITPDDTSATLHDRLADMGAELLIKTITGLKSHAVVPRPQDHDLATYAPLLKKSDGRIDWNKPAQLIEAFIRGMTPWPGAFTFREKKRLKIFKALASAQETTHVAGTVVRGFSDELRIATGRGTLSICEIQGASGKRLDIKDYLRGHTIEPGSVFS
ncbi:MAG: methionyl-tRNA formyltransferase [Deltaproteobacteria bacterium]|nr:methionyl-tRNA formyltransferase [Deltaproteobacteria bacterium]